MRDATGSPEASVILYAIQAGAYDQRLSEIAGEIKRRRTRIERIGMIQPSRGDTIVLFDDIGHVDLRKAELQVVGFTSDKRIRARLLYAHGKYAAGTTFKLSPDLVDRVIYFA